MFDNTCGNVYMYLCVLICFVCVYICNNVNVKFVCFFFVFFICLLIFCLFVVYFTNHYFVIVCYQQCIKGKRI